MASVCLERAWSREMARNRVASAAQWKYWSGQAMFIQLYHFSNDIKRNEQTFWMLCIKGHVLIGLLIKLFRGDSIQLK